MIFYQLFRPFDYLRIDQKEKRIADWYIPGIMAILFAIGAFVLRGNVNVYGRDGIISMVLSFIQNLPGFYIAALAAIATFGRTDIDSIMPGNPPPSIQTYTTIGKRNRIPLTRRRFLCLLFAFLTIECILLTLVSIGGISIAPFLRTILDNGSQIALYLLGIFIYFFLLIQLIVVTFWGLYYLGDRIHQPDS